MKGANVVAAIILSLGAVLIAAGTVAAFVQRRRSRGRVRVQGVVVDVPPSLSHELTFDYPVPGGVARATRSAHAPGDGSGGFFPRPGTAVTVYVDPARPDDPQLGMVRASGVLAMVFILMGVGLVGIGLFWVAISALLPPMPP